MAKHTERLPTLPHPPVSRAAKKHLSLHRPASELHNLCRNGDLSLVGSYLHDTVISASVNQTGGSNGCAPIHEAAMTGQADIIRLLYSELEYLDINIRTDEGPASTPLHLAAQRGKAEAVIALVDCGAILDSVDRCWRTPLDVAVEHGQLHVAHVLKLYEMSRTAETENLALLEKILQEVEGKQHLPMSLHSWHQDKLDEALFKAAKIGSRKVVSLLVKHGARNFQECMEASPQTNHITSFLVLCLSALNGDIDAINILLHPNEEFLLDEPRYTDLMMYRLILAPLLQNGKVSLSIPIQVALLADQLKAAGRIVLLSSLHPSSGIIDWHDLELTHIDSTWFDSAGVSNLVYIGLSSNRLRCLPEPVTKFHSLQKLQIHHNCISCLPAHLFTMPHIKEIDASFNNLVALPEVLMQPVTQSLVTLNVSNNRLTDLPDYFINSNVKSLDISYNRLHRVPDCVIHLRRLHTLSLDNNIGIESLPYELGNLRNLVLLGLEGLPYLKNIPSMEKMMPLDFLRSRARTLQLFTHYDVVIISNDEYKVCLQYVNQTISQHSRRKHYSYLKFSHTQQFLHFQRVFALPSTTYLIVWDCQAGQSADDLFPIISHLTVYAPSSPIIVVACWTSAITPMIESSTQDQINNSMWKEHSDTLTVITICVDKDALVSRSNTLQYLMDVVHRKGESVASQFSIPNSYYVLRDLVHRHGTQLTQESNPPLIDEWQLWELARTSNHNDLAGRKELPLAISYLSNMASILCLPSNRSDEKNYYVLDRQWFLDAISGLLHRHQNVSDHTGLYPIPYLCDLLACSSLQSTLPYALCLFVSEIGLAIAVTSHKALIPTMLPFHNTTSIADYSSQYEVRRVYTFRCTPVAFWGRLIAHLLINMNHLMSVTSVDNTGELVDGFRKLADCLPGEDMVNWHYWKQGMVVWIGGATLLFSVEAITPLTQPVHFEGLEIRVSNTPIGVKAMNLITATINTLIRNWYTELWQTVEVSVPCPKCIDEGKYTLFSFQECCKAVSRRNVGGIQCNTHDEVFFPESLVPDLMPQDGDKLFATDGICVNIHDKSSCLSVPPSETIFRGEYAGKPIAMKPFPPPVPNGVHSSKPYLDFWHEFTILRHLSTGGASPFVIDLLVSTTDPLGLVFPRAPFCSLEEVIQEREIPLVLLLRIRILYQLANALDAVHSLKLIHRNVCTANVLVFSLSLDDSVNIKLGGFSDSCIALNQGLAVGEYGTFPAPEMSKTGYQYDERVDVFAYAFTSYEVLTRRKLKFRRGVRFQAASGASDRPPLNDIGKLAPYFTPLLERCWKNDESKRPFFVEVISSFHDPLHILTREGEGLTELKDFNAAAVRFTRKDNGSYMTDLYLCSSIFSSQDSAELSHLSLPGLKLQASTSLPSRCVICMCCTSRYLWVSFQHKYVRVYSTDSLMFIQEIRFEAHVLVMAVSPNAVYLGLENGELQMYNMSQPSPLHSAHKTRIICFQKPIIVMQVLDDCVMCCTKRSCIRVHPETLHAEQEFPVVSETEVKFAVLCVDREHDEEFLWVGFRRWQQLVIFNALTGKAIYGANCCEVLDLERHQVWVTSMLSVLDTVWVGLNTGHILVFSAYDPRALLFTHFKVHTEKVSQLTLLQPAYWGSHTFYHYDDMHSSNSEDSAEDYRSSANMLPLSNISMPRSMLVLSCGQGIAKSIPKIGYDGVVMTERIERSTPGLYTVMMDAPDSTGAHKLECQAHRPAVPYMEQHENELTESSIYESLHIPQFYESSTLGDDSVSTSVDSFHRSIPSKNIDPPLHQQKLILDSGEYSSIHLNDPDPYLDPNLRDWEVVSFIDVPPPVPPRRKTFSEVTQQTPPLSHNSKRSGTLPSLFGHTRKEKRKQKKKQLLSQPIQENEHNTTECVENGIPNETPQPYDSDEENEFEPYIKMESATIAMMNNVKELTSSFPKIPEGDDTDNDSLPSNPSTPESDIQAIQHTASPLSLSPNTLRETNPTDLDLPQLSKRDRIIGFDQDDKVKYVELDHSK